MGQKQSFPTKPVHFVSDLTTILLNPISDNNKPLNPPPPSEESEGTESEGSTTTSLDNNEDDLVDGPDTSSFTAFLFSLFSSSDDKAAPDVQNDDIAAVDDTSIMKENLVVKKSLFSRSRQALGRVIYQDARMGGVRNQDLNDVVEMTQAVKELVVVSLVDDLPQISEPSMLLSDSIRNDVYVSLPALIHGRKWMLLYSTWKHGISHSTLYQRSMVLPGISLLEESEGTESEGSRTTSLDNNEDDLVDGPDTSSFTAFLFSLLSCSDDKAAADAQNDDITTVNDTSIMKENLVVKKSLFSRSKQSLGRVIYEAARIGGVPNQDRNDVVEMTQAVKEPVVVPLVDDLPQISEPSVLLSDSIKNVMYVSLPALIHGRKWMLLYSTWKHGISLSTLYRRSMLWPGISLLVVGDRKGAVFGGLVEAPLIASNRRKYQGTYNSFVFTNISGHPVIYRPTGVNLYFTLCTTDSLAIGGGGHFALYLDGDLLNGSSSVSETYGNPCLAHSQEFEVKEVELWGFVFPSKYDEIVALSKAEAPGICRW